jgi:glycosyltransferase involved in cell wall biosynthesis
VKLHTVIVTHNRLELTKQVIASYLDTVTVPFTLWVVDNASTDGTMEWLADQDFGVTILPKNYYPGYATNRGWEWAPDDATHLQRADNDMAFLPGWCNEVQARFGRRVGQVGLRTLAEEFRCYVNTGGNCVIRRELFFDHRLRWDERPWTAYPAGLSEDTFFSPKVKKLGYQWTRVKKPCLESLATHDWEDPYYAKSYGDRKINRPRGKRYGTR